MTVSRLPNISANFFHLEVKVAAIVVNLVNNVQHLSVFKEENHLLLMSNTTEKFIHFDNLSNLHWQVTLK